MKELAYLNKYIVKYKWHFLFGVLFVALSNVFKVLSPRILSYAIDMVAGNINLYKSLDGFSLQDDLTASFKNALLIFSLIFLASALLGGVFTFLMRQAIIVMSRLIEYDLKNEIYQHYQKLDTAFYKKNNTGDLMNRATEDVSRVRMYLGPALMYLINVVFLSTFVIVTMLSINVKLTLWTLLPLPFLTVSIFYVNNLINKGSEQIQEQLSVLTTQAQEYYSGIRVLKSYVQEKLALKDYIDLSEEYKTRALNLAQIESLFFPLMVFLVGLSTIIVVIVGGHYVREGSVSPGNIVEFIMYVNLLTWPVTAIGWAASLIQRAAASQRRINQFLKTQPTINSKEGMSIEFEGEIKLKDVDLWYNDTGIVALKNINLHIKPGEKWAIMGRTGSGKTTLAELIMGLYYPTKGKLEIDNHDIRDIQLHQYRKQIGYIPQDVFLFSDTIHNNIKFGNVTLRDEEAEYYAKKASIYDEIMEFPSGFKTLLGERGVTLSGGQKQRISIARALANKPQLIIFDDALSAVDVQTETQIIENMGESFQDKTVIVISHRIFSSIDFDQIVILEDGEILEQGKHDELIVRNGLYADFYNKQQTERT